MATCVRGGLQGTSLLRIAHAPLFAHTARSASAHWRPMASTPTVDRMGSWLEDFMFRPCGAPPRRGSCRSWGVRLLTPGSSWAQKPPLPMETLHRRQLSAALIDGSQYGYHFSVDPAAGRSSAPRCLTDVEERGLCKFLGCRHARFFVDRGDRMWTAKKGAGSVFSLVGLLRRLVSGMCAETAKRE